VRLTVETGPLAGTVIPLDRERPTVLGSGEDCAVRIREAGVQPQHAVVKALKDQGFGIKALAAGLRVNGAAIEATPLADGDVIELGTTRIAFGERQEEGLPTIAGYRLIEELGRGGMGTVYRAEQVSLHRQVALKVLGSNLTRDPAFVARFVAEARAAAKLQHPNVVQVFDVDQDGDRYYISMELMHDGSLEDQLKQQGRLDVDRALQVVADAAAGLAYAESLGIVHRDIKPDNLMLDQHGQVKIADLGLASSTAEIEQKAIGTPHFMAPEQVLKKELDHRTDLYALGCTFYRLVTGKTPFRGQTVRDILRAQVKDEPEPANKANPQVSAEVAAIIARLLQKDPAQRYQTANELLDEIEVLRRPKVRRGLWIGLAAAAVLVAGGAIYWAVTKPKEKEIVERIYDDPEKQEFADRIKVLEGEKAEDQATIALLRARLSGLTGEELALAFDAVANEHAGRAAAKDAAQRAAAARAEVAAAATALERRRARIAEHVAARRRATLVPLDAGDFAAALRQLDEAPPQELAGEELAAGLARVREEIVAAADARLRERREAAAAALRQSIDALAAELQNEARWPAAVATGVADAKAELTAAQQQLTDLERAKADRYWTSYHALFAPEAAGRRQLDQLDFAALAATVAAFTEGDAGVAAPRAKGFAAFARHAALFSTAFEAAINNGQVQLAADDGPGLVAVRWDRTQGQLVFAEPQRRTREQTMATSTLSIDVWTGLTAQVDGAPEGSRECFLGLVALRDHADAARVFLSRLAPADDATGTGDGSYPLGADLFDVLLRRLPEQPAAGGAEPEWLAAARDELLAGQRLAAGLRALSERRNLAAAGHVEKLLADHAHSFVVAALP
jgi:hypothetical protein